MSKYPETGKTNEPASLSQLMQLYHDLTEGKLCFVSLSRVDLTEQDGDQLMLIRFRTPDSSSN